MPLQSGEVRSDLLGRLNATRASWELMSWQEFTGWVQGERSLDETRHSLGGRYGLTALLDYLTETYESADQRVAAVAELVGGGRFDPESVESRGPGWWAARDEGTDEWRFLRSDVLPGDPNAAGLNWITQAEFFAAAGRRFNPRAMMVRRKREWWVARDERMDEWWFLRSDVYPEDPNEAGLNWITQAEFLAATGRFIEDVIYARRGWWMAQDEGTREWWFLRSDDRPGDPNAAGLNWITEAEFEAARGANPANPPTYPFGQAPAYDDLPSGVGVTLTAGGSISAAGQAEVETCAICQENFTADEIAQPAGGCPHYFHWACLAAWAYPSNALVQHNPNDPRAFPRCPTCRGTLRSRPGDTPKLTPLKITATPEATVTPEIGLRSDDGLYWWDGTAWQPVTEPPDQQPAEPPASPMQPEPTSAEDALSYVIDTYRDNTPESDPRRSLFYRSGETDFIRDVTITLPTDATGTPDRTAFTINSEPSTTESGETIWQLDLTDVTADGHSADSSALLCANPATRTAYIILTL